MGGQENDDFFPLKIELHIKLDGQAHMRCDAQSVKKHPPSLFRWGEAQGRHSWGKAQGAQAPLEIH